MNSKLSGGHIGLLIGVAAAIAALFGVVTYIVQSADNGDSRALVTLRLHDEVVSWPNHAALQREAVAAVNDADGQQIILQGLAESDQLIDLEASTFGDPATVEIVASATNDDVALAAVQAAADLAIDQAVLDRAVPIVDQLAALRTDFDAAVQERDVLLGRLADGIDDDTERAVSAASVESIAGVVSTLEIDIARLEADLSAKIAPLVAVGDPQLVSENASDLKSALAGALGIFFLSLLGLSMIGAGGTEVGNETPIDLRSLDRGTQPTSVESAPQPQPSTVE
jgi:hypothetical protein